MKKLFILAFVAVLFSSTTFAQSAIQAMISRSNADYAIIAQWQGWNSDKVFPTPNVLNVGDVVENIGYLFTPAPRGSHLMLWIQEVNPESGEIRLVRISAEIFGTPAWERLQQFTEPVAVTVKLEILPGDTKRYWAWFGSESYVNRSILH